MTEHPVARLLARLEAHGCRAKQNGKGWMALCPTHHDRRPSLSVDEGDGGTVLLYCHAGCKTEDICRALGLDLRDLMSDDNRRPLPQTNGCKQGFRTAEEAIAALRSKLGGASARWNYRDARRAIVDAVLRWDTAGGDLADVMAAEDWCGLPLAEGASSEDLGRWLIAQADRIAPAARAEGIRKPADPSWQPYPIDALPEPIRRFLVEEFQGMGCEPVMLALPLLAALGAAIGTTRRIAIKPWWRPGLPARLSQSRRARGWPASATSCEPAWPGPG